MRRSSLDIGFSPCPNDTFMFHALVHGIVVLPGMEVRPVLADIDELNRRAAGDRPLPVTKLSVGAIAGVADRYAILDAGAALGHGVGPLIVARQRADAPGDLRGLAGRRVAIPGERTTANLLLGLFGPSGIERVAMGFDGILAAVATGEVDAGVIIHESRFSYAEHGLVAIADLGAVWEQESGLPLPLGVIAVSRGLPQREVAALEHALRASVRAAFADPTASAAYVRAHSQELSDSVCAQHIALYVNEFSTSLGARGRAAIDELTARGRERGILPDSGSPWQQI